MCSINLLVVQVVAEEVDDFYDQPSKMISSEKEYYTTYYHKGFQNKGRQGGH